MKVELSESGPVKRVMAIEVDAEEMARETERVLRSYAQKARLPGFRQGRVPLALVRARFGKDVESDVRQRVMTRCFQDAAREKALVPLGDPVLDDVSQPDEQGLRFRVSFEVLPEFELRGHRGVEVRRPAAVVDEAEVERVLEELRQSQARLVTREGRAAEPGDVLLCDVAGTPTAGPTFRRERALIQIGAPPQPPSFHEHLSGGTAGADLEFVVDYAPEHEVRELAGRSVHYEIHVHEVKVREVPPLDDELAKDVGDFEDLTALRARLRADLEARMRHEVERRVRQAVLDEVLLRNPIVLPETLVADEVRHRLEQLVRSMVLQGIDPQKVELDWKRLRDEQLEPARKTVHARLVLDVVARTDALEVRDDELDERVRRDAEAMGEKFEVVRRRLREGGGAELLRAQLLREKSLDLLTSVANIHDEVK